MFGAVFQGGGQGQATVGGQAAQWADAAQGQAAFGERAGLVEDDRVDLVEAFEHVATGDQQAEFVQGARCRGQGRWRGQRQRARTGRHQHRQDDPEGPRGVQVPPPQTNDHGGHQGEQEEPLRGPVGNFRQARLFGLCAFEQADDGRQARIMTKRFDFHVQRALDIQRAAGDPLADAARLRQVLAGQQ
ncbi:hypothetical protein D3C76_770400 [compost metagenome]